MLIRVGVINRYIVPMPSQIAAAFERVIVEEDLAARFRLTFIEALTAGAMITVVGVTAGMLLYRFELWRRATETWIAALASAPTVLMYPLFLVIFGRSAWTIIMMGFVAGLPPVILKTIEGLATTRRVLINVGRSFNLSPTQSFTKILLPAALPTIFVGIRLGLIFTLINVVGVEFLINFGGLGQLDQRSRRALRSARHLCRDLLCHSGQRRVFHRHRKGRAMAETGAMKRDPCRARHGPIR